MCIVRNSEIQDVINVGRVKLSPKKLPYMKIAKNRLVHTYNTFLMGKSCNKFDVRFYVKIKNTKWVLLFLKLSHIIRTAWTANSFLYRFLLCAVVISFLTACDVQNYTHDHLYCPVLCRCFIYVCLWVARFPLYSFLTEHDLIVFNNKGSTTIIIAIITIKHQNVVQTKNQQ